MKEVTYPGGDVIFCNGIYLTRDAIEAINALQTGGTLGWSRNDCSAGVFDNASLLEKLSDIDKVSNKFISLVSLDFVTLEEAGEYLLILNDIRWYFERLAAPEKLAHIV